MTIDNPSRSAAEILELIIADTKVAFYSRAKKLYRPSRYTSKDKMPSHRDAKAHKLVKDCKEFILTEIESRVEGNNDDYAVVRPTFMANRHSFKTIVDAGFSDVLEARKRIITEWPIHEGVVYYPVTDDMIGIGIALCIFPLLALIIYSVACVVDVFAENECKRDVVLGGYYFCTRKTCAEISLRLTMRESADAIFDNLVNYVRTIKDQPPSVQK